MVTLIWRRVPTSNAQPIERNADLLVIDL